VQQHAKLGNVCYPANTSFQRSQNTTGLFQAHSKVRAGMGWGSTTNLRPGGGGTPNLNRTEGGGFVRDNSLNRKGGGEGFSGSSARGTAVPITTLKLGGGWVGVLGQKA
jgi:hypothetical protein